MTWFIVLGLSFASGFISLSYEILWARLFTWSTAGSAAAFPMLLGLFLAGIALGAKWSKRFTNGKATYSPEALRSLAMFIGGGALAGWLVIPAMAWLVTLHVAIPGFTALYFVFGAACIFGAQLPVLMHYGIAADSHVGSRLSYVYVANIAGSVGGSLITGFIWLDVASTASIAMVLTIIGLALAFVLFASTRPDKAKLAGAAGALVACIAVVVGLTGTVYSGMLEKLYYGPEYESQEFKYVFETKSGFIAVDEEDVAIGGGVYDGTFSIDLIDDVNGIVRPYSLSAFHEDPKTVLVVGMATGSWSRVLVEHPGIEKVTIIEISPGYFDLISKYPESAVLLDHPKVELVEDDARRWMHTNDRKFDAIISNTSFHQRGFSSTLLSEEFMQLMKDHLNPKGIVMVNTTGSKRALRSMLNVYDHCVAYMRSGICSDHEIKPDTERWRGILEQFKIDGKPVYDPAIPEHKAHIDELMEEMNAQEGNFVSAERMKFLAKDYETITDANMGHEWQFDMLGMSSDSESE